MGSLLSCGGNALVADDLVMYRDEASAAMILMQIAKNILPDSKVHGANVGPIWGRQDPGGPHVGPMNFAIWAGFSTRKVDIRELINWCIAQKNIYHEIALTPMN